MTPATRTIDPDAYTAAEQQRLAAARRWGDTIAEQNARRIELDAAAAWWESKRREGARVA